jgi:hypothetical protein
VADEKSTPKSTPDDENPWVPGIEARRVVTDYWFRHYCADFCTLCGNRGWLDTTGTRTPAGVLSGRLNYCLCPNGQALRAGSAELPVPERGGGPWASTEFTRTGLPAADAEPLKSTPDKGAALSLQLRDDFPREALDLDLVREALADAERYRWLRDRGAVSGMRGIFSLMPGEWDEAIDAAMPGPPAVGA